MGRGYVIEHCISALKLNREEQSFKIYVTDALRAIADNTTHLLSVKGVVDYGITIQSRWIDLLKQPHNTEVKEPEDTRTADEIATEIWNNIRGH